MNNNNESDLQKTYISILSIFGDAYLLKTNDESVKDLLAKEGKTYELGSELYGIQAVAIKNMLNEEMSLMGLNLQEEVAKHGETFDKLSFSNYENQILQNKVANLGFILHVLEDQENK